MADRLVFKHKCVYSEDRRSIRAFKFRVFDGVRLIRCVDAPRLIRVFVLWADAPRGPSHYSEVQVGLEVTHSAKDSNLWMASLMAAAYDPGRASVHAFGHLCELPSL